MKRMPRASTRVALATLAGIALGGCGGGDDSGGRSDDGLNPQPAFYLTAANARDLGRQAYAAGERFARSQGPGRAVLVLDFGGARLRSGTYGAALRGGTFFSNDEIGAALQRAADGYEDHHTRGTVTIVYANSNALLDLPAKGDTRFSEDIARRAGEEQAKAIRGLKLSSRQSATVGGDIEPGYDVAGKPEISIAMVAGANAVARTPYHNVGTAPCDRRRCINGWTPRDICRVAAGDGLTALPEIYTEDSTDQPEQWARITRACGIKSYAGVSSSPVGDISPARSLQLLRQRTGARVRPVVVVWPG
jgi:hypothetical protein